MIYMLQSPALGSDLECVGAVRAPDGSVSDEAESYRVVMYIRVDDAGDYWVKPGLTDADGNFMTLPVDSEGMFHAPYYTYGDSMEGDLKARYIHLLLVPEEFVPTMNGFAEALRACVDHVCVTREPDGTVSVSEERVLPRSDERAVDLPVSPEAIAVNVGFYTSGAPNEEVDEATMRAQLTALKPYADTVRFYAASGTSYKAYAMAKEMGYTVIGNAWIAGDEEADMREMDALIEHANNGLIAMAVVGSETQYAGLTDADTLIARMEYVRERVPEGIPVTTAETLGIVIGNAKLCAACDVLFVNGYPVYEGISVDEAAGYLTRQLETLRAMGNGRTLIVSETGWPAPVGDAAVGAEAARYFEEIRAWSLETGTNVVYFEAFDEPWKSAYEPEYGAHWGFMTKELAVKDAYADILK